MLNRQTTTFIILILSVALFIVSSETAARIDHSQYDYANPMYISNVIVALASTATALYCILDLHGEAERKVKQFNLFRHYDAIRSEMFDDFLEKEKEKLKCDLL